MNIEERFWSKVIRGDGCWEWQAARGKHPNGEPGYGQFHIGSRTGGVRRMHAAHRVAWELERGKIPDGMKVLHRCDNPACVRPDHLFIGTQMDNVEDMVSKGRHSPGRGERHWCAKLSAEKVREIRAEYVRGVGGPGRGGNALALAAKFGVTRAAIYEVVRRGWRHVQ